MAAARAPPDHRAQRPPVRHPHPVDAGSFFTAWVSPYRLSCVLTKGVLLTCFLLVTGCDFWPPFIIS
eukprot:11205244-Alexandrium_andersonii.AAC.1